METYHFFTHWSFAASIDQVWAEIIDGTTWPEWLQDFRKVTPLDLQGQAEVGAIVDIEYRGDLPYTFPVVFRSSKCLSKFTNSLPMTSI
jgi:hypothetical protein